MGAGGSGSPVRRTRPVRLPISSQEFSFPRVRTRTPWQRLVHGHRRLSPPTIGREGVGVPHRVTVAVFPSSGYRSVSPRRTHRAGGEIGVPRKGVHRLRGRGQGTKALPAAGPGATTSGIRSPNVWATSALKFDTGSFLSLASRFAEGSSPREPTGRTYKEASPQINHVGLSFSPRRHTCRSPWTHGVFP